MSTRPEVELKLKQASAVLGVSAKDLQNLVQFKVLRPRRKGRTFWFDNRLLLEAKIAFYLKDSLGAPMELLARFTAAVSKSLKRGESVRGKYVSLHSRPARGQEPLEVRIPLATLVKELNEQLPRAEVYQDLPRGRKKPGWRHDLARKLAAAANDLSGVTESQVADAIREYRAEKKRLPEITVGGPKRAA
jgi:hypothetical protein